MPWGQIKQRKESSMRGAMVGGASLTKMLQEVLTGDVFEQRLEGEKQAHLPGRASPAEGIVNAKVPRFLQCLRTAKEASVGGVQ